MTLIRGEPFSTWGHFFTLLEVFVLATVWLLGLLTAGAVYALLFGRQWEFEKQEALIRKGLHGVTERTVPFRTGVAKWAIWEQAAQAGVSRQVLWAIGWLAGLAVLFIVDFFMGSLVLAVPIALVAGYGAVVLWIRFQFKQRQALIRDAFMDEVIPLGVQILGAVNKLEEVFPLAAESVSHPAIQAFFSDLHQSWKPRGLTPEEAFYEALKKWRIPELTQLGAITMLSQNRSVELSGIWLEYHTLITNDLQRRKEAEAKTYGIRNSALIFVVIIGVFFLIGAKVAARWITPTIADSLYMVFAALAGVAWWIWKQKDAIDV